MIFKILIEQNRLQFIFYNKGGGRQLSISTYRGVGITPHLQTVSQKTKTFLSQSSCGWYIRVKVINCHKSNPNFQNITRTVVEHMIPHEQFRVVSRFPCYISCYIAENRIPLGQCKEKKFEFSPEIFVRNLGYGIVWCVVFC